MRARWRAAAPPARALAEGLLVAAVILLAIAGLAPIEPVNALWASLGVGAAYAGIAGGAVVAGRARAPEGSFAIASGSRRGLSAPA